MTPDDDHINPDCLGGKHTACGGDAWCFIEDARVSCSCVCHKAAA